MENLSNEIRKTDAFKQVRKNPFLWSILKIFLSEFVIKVAKDLLDDGKLNDSVK